MRDKVRGEQYMKEGRQQTENMGWNQRRGCNR